MSTPRTPEQPPRGPKAAGQAARLPDGALRALVAAHLHAYPGLDFSAAELANALGRPGSRGAVINACHRLVADGIAVLACRRPQRFQAAPHT